MSYLQPKESMFSQFWNKITFGYTKPKNECIRFRNIDYTDEHEEYTGLSSVFQSSSEGICPTYNVTYPVGIPNIGNTCYMNALIQGLIACDHLEEYVNVFKAHLSKSGSDTDSDSSYFTLDSSTFSEHHILTSFISAYTSIINGDTDLEKVSKFYDILCETFTDIFQQEDAHELLMLIFGFFNDYARKQTQLKPRLDYMRGLVDMVKSRNSQQEVAKSMIVHPPANSLGDSTSTMTSSFKSDIKGNLLKTSTKGANLSSRIYNGNDSQSSIRSGFEGLINPFATILTSKFT
jgi:hypothetical protein